MLTRALALKSMLLMLAGSTIFGIAIIFVGSEFSYPVEGMAITITVALALLISALPKVPTMPVPVASGKPLPNARVRAARDLRMD